MIQSKILKHFTKHAHNILEQSIFIASSLKLKEVNLYIFLYSLSLEAGSLATEILNRSKLNQKWWRSKISKLHKEFDKASPTEKKMLSRLLYKVFAHAIETASIGDRIKNTNQSILCYEICIMIYPKYYLPYFKQIENYVDLHEEETALNYLEKLIETGYTDLNNIYKNKAINSLKENDKYTSLINKIK